jgi:tripartite-type tricarboxylate transporter receptor subunit TctC
MKKAVSFLVLSLAAIAMLSAQGKYPAKNITAVVMFGAGGSTDVAMRPLMTIAEKQLGKSIIVQNMGGGSGAIATQYVTGQKSDGYTLLIGAENAALYDAYDFSKLTYNDFIPIIIAADTYNNIVVRADSPYNSVADLIKAEKAKPGKVLKSRSGPAGISAVFDAMFELESGVKFTPYTADSSSSSMATIMGGFADFGLASLASSYQYVKAGKLKVISQVCSERNPLLPNVPTIVEELPGFAQYLPSGAFYTVVVKKGTPQDIVDTLIAAFKKAYESAEYQKVLKDLDLHGLGYTGAEAKAYIDTFRKNSMTVLVKNGDVKKTMKDLGY